MKSVLREKNDELKNQVSILSDLLGQARVEKERMGEELSEARKVQQALRM